MGLVDHHEGFAPTVVVITTCREDVTVDDNINNGEEAAEAAEARRAEEDEAEFNENKREGGVGTHSLMLALKAGRGGGGGRGEFVEAAPSTVCPHGRRHACVEVLPAFE